MAVNGNTNLSDTARQALERIRTLRLITQKTAIQTHEEQYRTLLGLENADALAVAELLFQERAPNSPLYGGAR